MTYQPNNNTAKNSWNPFIPTKKDIARTDELASKNATLAGILTLFFTPAGLLYLNRGVNPLKIIGYVFAICFMFGLVARTEEEASGFGSLAGLIGSGVITAEQVMAVKKAHQRLQEKSTSASAYSFERNNGAFPSSDTSTEAMELLKQLKGKYEANEISEEEFKMQKQRVLSSL